VKTLSWFALFFFQQLIAWGCIWLFFHAAQRLFKSTAVAVGVSLYLVYLQSRDINNFQIMTESLSISGMMILGYLLFSYIRRPGYGKAMAMSTAVFLLIMLRPAFVFLLPVFLLLWLARFIMCRGDRFREATGLLSITVALVLVLGYCQLFKQKYGDFSLSDVTWVNQANILLQSGLYRYGSDPVINDLISTKVEEWKNLEPLERPAKPKDPQKKQKPAKPLSAAEKSWVYLTGIDIGGIHDIFSDLRNTINCKEYVQETIRHNRVRYICYSLGKFIGLHNEPFIRGIELPRFHTIYGLLLMEILTLAVTFYATRQVPWFWGVCWLVIAGMVFTAVVGAQGEWTRLVVPVVPFGFLLIAKYVDLIIYVLKEKEHRGQRIVQYLQERSTVQEGGESR
jgi:hypothetical protein